MWSFTLCDRPNRDRSFCFPTEEMASGQNTTDHCPAPTALPELQGARQAALLPSNRPMQRISNYHLRRWQPDRGSKTSAPHPQQFQWHRERRWQVLFSSGSPRYREGKKPFPHPSGSLRCRERRWLFSPQWQIHSPGVEEAILPPQQPERRMGSPQLKR